MTDRCPHCDATRGLHFATCLTLKTASPERTVSIRFNRAELWELVNNFDASFQDGAEGNELATAISYKLHSAFDKLA